MMCVVGVFSYREQLSIKARREVYTLVLLGSKINRKFLLTTTMQP
jgi:hypothetical protein